MPKARMNERKEAEEQEDQKYLITKYHLETKIRKHLETIKRLKPKR